MIFEGVILSIIVGYIRKGKLSHFENVDIKLWYLLSVAFLIQIVALRVTQLNNIIFYALHLLSYVIIMYVLVLNIKLLSMKLLFMGNFMNFIVIAFNRGKMPVDVPIGLEPIFDRGHTLLTSGTNIAFLADNFVLRIIGFPTRVFSVGDLFLVIGAFMFIQYVMLLKIKEE